MLQPDNHSSPNAYWPIFLAWAVSAVATLGSLFFSEVMKLPPCSLCWYQRVGLFPLVPIFALGVLKSDRSFFRYALPVYTFGLFVAIYHNLLYYGVIPETFTPCSAGASCTSGQQVWFGFLTIPMLSLTAFVSIGICLFIYKRIQK